MTTAAQVLEVARSQIGITENPAGSNRVKYAAWAGIQGQPWCAAFTSWCFYESGAAELIGNIKHVYTPTFANWFTTRGQWIKRGEEAQPGDVVFFHNSERICHVGIVESYAGGNLVTIEGNTSVTSNDNGGAVMRRNRTLGSTLSSWYVAGYGRPLYDKETEMQLSDAITRPDGHVGSVGDILAYTDMRVEKMGSQLDALTKKATKTNRELNEVHARLDAMSSQLAQLRVLLEER